jgi:hypothetical protein
MKPPTRYCLIAAIFAFSTLAGGGVVGAQTLTRQWGTDMRGADYTRFPARGAEECQSACASDGRCAAYTYRLDDRTCYLKGAVPAPSQDRNAVSGFKTGGQGWTGGGGGWGGRLSEQWGLDRRGGDYTSFAARDLRQCQSQCLEQPQCRAYTFRRDTRECFLKSVVNSPRRDDGVVTGTKGGGGGGGFGRLTEERGFDRRGGDYNGFASPGVPACKQACAGDRRCRAYTYRFDTRECFLKDRVYRPSRDDRTLTGVKE